jgi:hypothetical protein
MRAHGPVGWPALPWCAAVAILSAPGASGAAAPFVLERVDSTGSTGWYPAVAVAADGTSWIAYGRGRELPRQVDTR